MSEPIRVLWDNEAKSDLKSIFDFVKEKSVQSAKITINKIVSDIKKIRFVTQYPIDEILGEPYRKIIIKNYKVVYKAQNVSEIRILRIFDNRQHPNKLKIKK